MCIIKTANKQPPKAKLKQLPHRQAWKSLKLTSTKYSIYRLAWADKKLKLVITTGSTQNTDRIIYATKNKIKQIWDNKCIINYLTSSKHVIKNVILSLKCRGYEKLISSGHLEARRAIEPISWTTRAISTVLGIIFVNKHLTMQLHADHDKIYLYTLKNDMDKFQYRLIFNPYPLNEQRDLCPRPGETEARTAPMGLRGNHILPSLTDSMKYLDNLTNSAKIWCYISHKPTRSFWVTSSDDSGGKYVAIWRHRAKKNDVTLCYYDHRNGL